MYKSIIYSLIALLFVPVIANAQYTFFNPKGSFAIEASLENTDELRMPIYRNAMSSLTVSGDFVLGGTTAQKGLSPLLFSSSLSQRKLTAVKQLDDVVKGQLSIGTGFTGAKSGNVFYVGTMPQPGTGVGGHIIELQVNLKGQIIVKDLGEPVAGEGVFAMTFNPDKNEFYGIVHPSGKFFTFNLKQVKPRYTIKQFRLKRILIPIIRLHWNQRIIWVVHWFSTSRAAFMEAGPSINYFVSIPPPNRFQFLKMNYPLYGAGKQWVASIPGSKCPGMLFMAAMLPMGNCFGLIRLSKQL